MQAAVLALQKIRYWDATPCAEFGLQMAHEALDKDLRGESAFLARFDRVYKAVNDAIDMNGNDLALLVRFAVQNGGQLSLNRIKQFIAKGHPQQPTNANSQLTVPAAMGTFVSWEAFGCTGSNVPPTASQPIGIRPQFYFVSFDARLNLLAIPGAGAKHLAPCRRNGRYSELGIQSRNWF